MYLTPSVCTRCQRVWPNPCRCDDGGRPDVLALPLRPPGPVIEVKATFLYRSRQYRAEATYPANIDVQRAYPKPSLFAVCTWNGYEGAYVAEPSGKLVIKAIGELRAVLAAELRRRSATSGHAQGAP